VQVSEDRQPLAPELGRSMSVAKTDLVPLEIGPTPAEVSPQGPNSSGHKSGIHTDLSQHTLQALLGPHL